MPSVYKSNLFSGEEFLGDDFWIAGDNKVFIRPVGTNGSLSIKSHEKKQLPAVVASPEVFTPHGSDPTETCEGHA